MSDRRIECVWGVVVAAGRGRRFGTPKHAIRFKGKALWEWARDALLESGADQVVVVGPVPGGVEGGPERHISVACGLDEVDGAATIVAVHDAARPFAPARMIARMYTVMREERVDGVIPVVTIPDALKHVDGESGRVVKTLSRGRVFAAQTPQVFRPDVLRRAHSYYAGLDYPDPAPDDAAKVERIGGRVVTVPGDRLAMKITYPEDLLLARTLLARGSQLTADGGRDEEAEVDGLGGIQVAREGATRLVPRNPSSVRESA